MENSPALLQESSPSGLADVRLVATDMDGTLTSTGQFTEDLMRALMALAKANVATLIVTGRSAGWVQGIVAYLPVVGAIAENGGVFLPQETGQPMMLVDIADDIKTHRQQLAAVFAQIQNHFPHLRPAADNAFRLTDWTFDIGDLTPTDLTHIAKQCQTAGWGFTYSTVQCHIRPATQDKGPGLQRVLTQQFPNIAPNQVVTVGDSPNDEGLFDASLFPLSVGVANVQHYCDRLHHLPKFITPSEEVAGFRELVDAIINQQSQR
ncbi:HAD family hydrolase [Oscillatoria sp. CS-180]|uniref:HAD family hydrolase n=1 Tax=Oscillatoria sp. CS-180 TaxID=3021720 RepID=UPI00232BB7D2|nr:HAD family hydrolase [Oscillatoria sp. CS-180]MDB9529405.1 HAD family hydrolase [Oscillatoria sp. CS-180]